MSESRGRVLCVDDEPNIARALQWLLQKDFDVSTANNAQEGLALVTGNDFDVVISDQRMPGMTGVEFLREVRRVSPRAVRVLLTGYSDLQAILRSVNESEIYRFINKPWNISELPRVVEQAVTIARTHPVEPATPELTEDAPIAANAGQSVLLIDDSAEVLGMIEEVVGSAVRVHYAGNLAQAVEILDQHPVSVIVSETRVGSIDATRLIRLMKQQHPEIVSVMLSGQADAEMVTGLINQGQIFRFIPKPVRPGYLKLVINSALAKNARLTGSPTLVGRHWVDPTATGTMEGLLADVELQTRGQSRMDMTTLDDGGMIGRLSSGFKRLFSG